MTKQRSPRRALLALATALAVVGLLAPLGLGASPVAAQETPGATAGQADRIPCQVEPITGERFIAALDAAAATAATPGALEQFTRDTLPSGEPVDATTVEGISATVETALNCRNAGYFPRAYALFSDRMIGQLFGSRETVPPEIVALLQEPRRVRAPFRVGLVEVTEARRLPDGRVGALVVTANATHTFTDFLYFVDDNGQWLIDQAVVISAAPAATPAATPAP